MIKPTFKQVAVDAAKETGEMLLKLIVDDVKYTMKNSHDIQADGDLLAEKIIIGRITAAFPDHSILSEEAGEALQDSDYLWVIDPIDGTINFSRKLDDYCISIGLSYKHELILGVIYQPVLDKLFVAEKGGGTYLNGRSISVSAETELVNSMVGFGDTTQLAQRQQSFNVVAAICTKPRTLRLWGSAALGLARVASGQLDFFFKYHFHYWDFAAGIVLVQEAGGTVTDLAGQPITQHSTSILASNGIMHQTALNLLNA